jgi:hypothetical protein
MGVCLDHETENLRALTDDLSRLRDRLLTRLKP